VILSPLLLIYSSMSFRVKRSKIVFS